jgi:hypothetical protein
MRHKTDGRTYFSMLAEEPTRWYLSVYAEDMFVALGERLK